MLFWTVSSHQWLSELLRWFILTSTWEFVSSFIQKGGHLPDAIKKKKIIKIYDKTCFKLFFNLNKIFFHHSRFYWILEKNLFIYFIFFVTPHDTCILKAILLA